MNIYTLHLQPRFLALFLFSCLLAQLWAELSGSFLLGFFGLLFFTLVYRSLGADGRPAVLLTIFSILPAALLFRNISADAGLSDLVTEYQGPITLESLSVLPSGARRISGTIVESGKTIRVLLRSSDLPWITGMMKPGETVLIQANLKPLSPFLGPFEYGAHLRRRGYSATGELTKVEGVPESGGAIELPDPEGFAEMLHRKSAGRESAAIILASTLGDESLLSPSLRKLFIDTSLMHQLVVSGYQIGLLWLFVSALVGQLLRVFPHRWWALGVDGPVSFISFSIVLAYVIVLDDDVPSTRAWMALVVLIFSRLTGRTAHPLRTLGVLAYILWLVFPGSAFEMSFQLTFAALFGLQLGASYAEGRGRIPAYCILHCGPLLLTTPVLLLWTNRLCPGALFFNLTFGALFSLIFICAGGLSLLALRLEVSGGDFFFEVLLGCGELFLQILVAAAEYADWMGLGPRELSPADSGTIAALSAILCVVLSRRLPGAVVADESEFRCKRQESPHQACFQQTVSV